MTEEKGSISISTEDIFPIIKKWLYSEKDIFIRELVSNACDAVNKLSRLAGMGEAKTGEDEKMRVTVSLDKEAKTVSFTDNGIGMTADEVKKYINQIAFSGARDFLEKYKDNAADSQIIGHFGLGFYSAFMVSEKVSIDTLSYQEGAEAVFWESDGSSGYSMAPSARAERGTTVTLHLSDDGKEYLDRFTLRSVLVKYFRFLPVDLYLTTAEDKPDEEPKPVNEKEPLWIRQPQNCTPDDYKAFYKSVFNDFQDPLFWIHLNIDYPFRLKGILYFPKLREDFGSMEGQVKLYCNQVFVADNIKEVIPEYLLLLKGCVDCPDLPLNVSRSFLQNDGTVAKLQSHITRKVSDKLYSLFDLEREQYCSYWDDISPFIKYGCIRDAKFFEKMEKAVVFKTCSGEYKTVDEYLESAPEEEAHDHGHEDCGPDCDHEHHEHEHDHGPAKKLVYYTSDPVAQSQYVVLFKNHGIDAVVLNHVIDNPFISFLESKNQKLRFMRIDSDLSRFGEGESENEALAALVKPLDEQIKVRVQNMKEDGPPAVILLSEDSRRMREMMKQWGGGMSLNDLPDEQTLVFNGAHPLVKRLAESPDAPEAPLIAAQLHDLALVGFKPLSPEEMSRFVARSVEILEKI